MAKHIRHSTQMRPSIRVQVGVQVGLLTAAGLVATPTEPAIEDVQRE